ncbi:type 2 periplasmic-binding domain-containing protein [Paraglaciecola hydrolytica]|uniref:hypothetical protein n=1 Tax=Paraglaciecola hydrolytica TaxID=1799789 RepID=UPI0010427E12|nr:hypothetical protein [Paraglaciecola hydrolytica]
MTSLHAQNLVVGVEDIAYFPYFDFNSNENSFSKTILEKFATDNGHTISYVSLPVKQFSKWLHENNIDFKFPDNQRWHDPNVKNNGAEYYSNDVVYLRAGTIVLLKNKEKPKSFFKNLGMISGFDPTLWRAEIANNEINILSDTSPKVLMKHLVNGLVDGVDVDIAVAKFYLNSLGLDHQLTYSVALPQDVFSYQLSTIKYPEIIEQFNRWLDTNPNFLAATRREFHIPAETLLVQ